MHGTDRHFALLRYQHDVNSISATPDVRMVKRA
jgi:hypothetical protein